VIDKIMAMSMTIT